MASRKQERPGYEPAKGFPDPQAPAPAKAGHLTHYPVSQGAACNVRPVPTGAASYDPVDPSCPWCANYLRNARAVTAAQHPWAKVDAPESE